ncbi:MAG: hypothetical protein MJA29_09310, partial [Candidatus Omnitrophica bacterium]|nr:hypothetical protein [Candidatus Omnitrophota bacterium]
KDINTAEYSLQDCDLFINKDPMRGTALYIHKHLNAKECNIFERHDFKEAVWSDFKGKDGKKILIGCIYKSPNGTEENKEKLLNILRDEALADFDKIYIMGDFNFPQIKWNGKAVTSNDLEFVEALRDSFLAQMICEPTRYREYQESNILDLFLTNEEDSVVHIDLLPPVGKSYHNVIKIITLPLTEPDQDGTLSETFNLNRGNYENMRRDISSQDWNCLQAMDTNEAWTKIKETLMNTMHENIPKRKECKNRKLKSACMTRDV